MHVKVKIYKYPMFEVNVPEMGTIRDLQIRILTHLRIPITEHNLKEIFIFMRGANCNPFDTLLSLHISEKSIVLCYIKAKSLEKIEPTKFDDELEEPNDNSQNLNDNYSQASSNANIISNSIPKNNGSSIKNSNNSSNRLYQTSTYISNDSYSDFEDVPSNFSDFNFFYAQKDHEETNINLQNMQNQTLPLFDDLILTKEDNQRKGHLRQIKRYESLVRYSDEIAEKQMIRATSSHAINRNSNLCSSSFTSGENIRLSQDEPSCDSLPCCFPQYIPSSFSTTGISFLTNSKNEMFSDIFACNSSNKLTSNKSNRNKNDDVSNLNNTTLNNNKNENNNDNNNSTGNINDTDNDNNNKNSTESNNNTGNNDNNNNNNNEILSLDFSIKTEDHKSNF